MAARSVAHSAIMASVLCLAHFTAPVGGIQPQKSAFASSRTQISWAGRPKAGAGCTRRVEAARSTEAFAKRVQPAVIARQGAGDCCMASMSADSSHQEHGQVCRSTHHAELDVR
jgi:hypothetical protein